MTSSYMKDKPFKIDKRQVYKAYKAVKSNQGAAGVDGQTLQSSRQTGSEIFTGSGIE